MDKPKPYTIVSTARFEKDFRRLNRQTQERVLATLDNLQQVPYASARKLTGVKIGQYRIRVGDYRIRYDIEGTEVILYRVRHRREVYKQSRI